MSCIRHRPLKSGTRLSAVLERYIAEHTGRAIHDHKQVERLCDIYSCAAHTSMHMLFCWHLNTQCYLAMFGSHRDRHM